jgi:AcrR family transcriptional regulator
MTTSRRTPPRDAAPKAGAPRTAARPQPHPRTTYHHGDLPAALRDAARRLVAERGPDGFTLREAARAVGVDHAAVYRHFADKRALLAALAEDGFHELAAVLRAAVGDGDAATRLGRVAAAYVRFALDDPARFRLVSGPRLNEDGRHPSLERALGAAVDVFLGAVQEGMARGEIQAGAARDAAFAVLTMAHGFADLVLVRRIKARSTAAAVGYFETLVAPLLAGLRRAG